MPAEEHDLGSGTSDTTSDSVPQDDTIYDAKINDIADANIQQFDPSSDQSSKVHVAVSGPLLSESYSWELETAIVELVKKELAGRLQEPRVESSQGLDISLKGLGLSSALEKDLEKDLAATLGEQLQELVARQTSSEGS